MCRSLLVTNVTNEYLPKVTSHEDVYRTFSGETLRVSSTYQPGVAQDAMNVQCATNLYTCGVYSGFITLLFHVKLKQQRKCQLIIYCMHLRTYLM